jgi:hypothetical protein
VLVALGVVAIAAESVHVHPQAKAAPLPVAASEPATSAIESMTVAPIVVTSAAQIDAALPVDPSGAWVAGDMHTHTFITGGSNTEATVAEKALDTYNLDWMANSEHGGVGERDPYGKFTQKTPRWWSVINWSWPIITKLRAKYSGKLMVQATEWNVYGGGHAGVGFSANDPRPVAEFDYRFDTKSASRDYPGRPRKDNNSFSGSIAAIQWLQQYCPQTSYVVLNHPSRGLHYPPGNVREYLAAGPNVVAGFEGIPGHQRQPDRGDYNAINNPVAGTYQGTDPWLAKVGGFWDSLLGQGYRFSTFANSDFHSTIDDYWPGEYVKNWTLVADRHEIKSLFEGFKSGRTFIAQGDLIDRLKFSARAGDGTAVDMGRDALVVPAGGSVTVTVKFRAPHRNNHNDPVNVDHVDLIAGDVTGPAVRGTASWDATANPTARVVKSFSGADIVDLGNGWRAATCTIDHVSGPIYLRLRGSNVPVNTLGMSDATGNPVPDSGTAARATWKSLWFYSNPIWIDVR